MGNFFYRGGANALQRTVNIGTADVTANVGVVPFPIRVTAVKAYQDADITGTSLTLDVFARTTAGAAGNSLLDSTISLDVADQATGRAGQSGTLTTTTANLTLAKGQLLQAVFDATSVTAGPGDVTVVVEFEPV